MIPVRLAPEAIDELAEVAAWYRDQRPGLELEFLAEVARVIPLIGDAPASYPRLLDIPATLIVRRALLRRFPYGAVFMELGAEVRVLAFAHLKRRPGYWLSRAGPT